MKTILAVSFALAVIALRPADAIVYDAYACTLGVDCFDISHSVPGTPGPTNADFQAFYGAQLGLDLSGDTFTWTSHTAPTGDWFGVGDDFSAGIHAAYLWHDGAIVCCTLDDPYEIIDGNILGVFVGSDVYGVSNAGQPLYPAFVATVGGPAGLVPIDYQLSEQAMAFLSPDNDFHPVTFVGVPDGYGILAHWDFGYFELGPAEGPPLAHAPEPASALLLLPVLAVLRRRLKRSS